MSNTESAPTPKRAIVFSGGGARGAYEAGVLQFLLEDFPQRTGIEPNFDIVCGTSVGAIHACFLAGAIDERVGRGQRLVELWEGLQVDKVFRFSPTSLVNLPRRILSVRRMAEHLRAGQRPDRLYGLLNTEPLERLVLDAIPWSGIRRNLEAGRIEAVCVAATQIATGRAVIFVEQKDRRPLPPATETHIRMQPIHLMPVHALASAAIPLLFPSVRIGSRYYADGGLRLNTPLSPAVRLGANRILVIGLTHGRTMEVSEALAQQRTAGFGNPMFLLGKVLNALMLSPLEADLARLDFVNQIIESGEEVFGPDFLSRINQAGEHRGGRPLQRVQALPIRPSRDLGVFAGELARGEHGELELSSFLRLFIRTFSSGATTREADLLSYLLFDTSFTKPLADLGHADAMAKEEELVEFFTD